MTKNVVCRCTGDASCNTVLNTVYMESAVPHSLLTRAPLALSLLPTPSPLICKRSSEHAITRSCLLSALPLSHTQTQCEYLFIFGNFLSDAFSDSNQIGRELASAPVTSWLLNLWLNYRSTTFDSYFSFSLPLCSNICWQSEENSRRSQARAIILNSFYTNSTDCSCF